MINENRVLNEANSLFTQRKFDKALFLYSLLISNFPNNEEYPIYALLCDISIEDENKAIALFDYFFVLKKDDPKEAISYIKNVIHAYDGDIEKKEDFYDFVTKLIDNGFNNMAYNYLEGFQDYFFQDKEIVKLYKRLEEKQNETKHKQ